MRNKWIFKNVILPLGPFFIGGSLRLLLTGQISLSTFEGSEIAISLALFSFFMGQSLLNCDILLNDDEKTEELKSKVNDFYLVGAFFLIEFALLVVLDTLAISQQYSLGYNVMQVISFGSAVPLMFYAFKTQQAYRITARII